MARKQRSLIAGLSDANITPLADVTTTLIVVFLITMPALMWNGFDVNQAEAGGKNPIVQPTDKADDDLLTIAVTPAGYLLNGKQMGENELGVALRVRLGARADRTVVIVPDDVVPLGRVVTALDIAKASGAASLALLNRIGG
jgi:biopolymer transport protein ExbD